MTDDEIVSTIERLRPRRQDLLVFRLRYNTIAECKRLAMLVESLGVRGSVLFFREDDGLIQQFHHAQGNLLLFTYPEGAPQQPEQEAKMAAFVKEAGWSILFRPFGCRLDALNIRQMNAAGWFHKDQLGHVPDPDPQAPVDIPEPGAPGR
jgi:hypothetical protein